MLFSLKSINEGRVLIKSRRLGKNRKISKRRGEVYLALEIRLTFELLCYCLLINFYAIFLAQFRSSLDL